MRKWFRRRKDQSRTRESESGSCGKNDDGDEAGFASLKEQDRISYGVYAPETVAEQCYLLFYTRTGEVKGVVKKNDKELNDVRTKEATDIAVFSGCGAYWFILK